MQVVIPMSGAGARFLRAGYQEPKPLIRVDGRPMVEHVIGLFPGVTDFIFVCSRDHLSTSPLEAVLRNAAPTGRIVAIEPHNLGPVHTVLQAANFIHDQEPVIVSRFDFAAPWDFARFQKTVASLSSDAAITAYRGFHPHTLGPGRHTYLRHRNDKFLELRDKHSFTQDRTQEYAAAGTYYFRSGTLLKHYLHKAVALGLTTNGEYNTGAACNLMVHDGLHVSIHEVARYAEWHTPEDFEEYRGWSEYFARWAEWRPARPMFHGAALIPMAGESAAVGDKDPNHLISVAGIPIIERVLNTLPASLQTMAMCRADDLKNSPLSRVLRAARPGMRTISLSQKTEGHACLCLMPDASLDSRRPVLVAPSDSSLVYDEYRFAALAPHTDCVVFTFRNHAPANRNPGQYSWVTTGAHGSIEQVLLKTEPSGDVSSTQGITGMFWFREAGVMFDAVRQWVESGRRNRSAFDLSLIVEDLIERGFSVRALEVRHFISFAARDDIRTFEYWESYFRQNARHPYGKQVIAERTPVEVAAQVAAG